MRKVLVISYFFPPSGSTGGIRALKFVKYLREFGWEPVVLTSRSCFDFEVSKDDQLLSEIPPGVKVLRTASFEPLNNFWRKRYRASRKANNEGGVRHISKNTDRNKGAVIKKFFVSLLDFPDRYFGWFLFAVVHGIHEIWKERIAVVFVTNPPASALFAGFWVALLTGRPLVVDYRDPWIGKSVFFRPFEFMVFHYAKKIVVTSPQIYEVYRKRFPGISKDKYQIIYNGYDGAEDIQVPSKEKKLVFLHVGTLYSSHEPVFFLETLASVYDNDFLNKNVIVRFIGQKPDLPEELSGKLNSVMDYQDRMPRKECFKFVKEADILLAFLPDKYVRAGCVPSKIFDAMVFKKPVLGILHKGSAQELIDDSGIGITAAPGEQASLENFLIQVKDLFINEKDLWNFDVSRFNQYDRKNLTQQLSAVFDEVIRGSGK